MIARGVARPALLALLVVALGLALGAAGPAQGSDAGRASAGDAAAQTARARAVPCRRLAGDAALRCLLRRTLAACGKRPTRAARRTCAEAARRRYVIPAPQPRALPFTVGIIGFSGVAENAPLSALVPPNGVIANCAAPAANGLDARIAYDNHRLADSMTATWSRDGLVLEKSEVQYPARRSGFFNFSYAPEHLIQNGVYTFTVADGAGAVLARGQVTRTCPQSIEILGFKSFPTSASIPGSLPTDLTPPDGTITGCGTDSTLVVFWREHLPVGTAYQLVSLTPLQDFRRDAHISGGPDDVAFRFYNHIVGGVAVPRENGEYVFGWLNMANETLQEAGVTRAC